MSKDKRVCLINPLHKTYVRKQGYDVWHRYKDGYICNYCYSKLIKYPKITPEYRKKSNDKRRYKFYKEYDDKKVRFFNRFVNLGFKLRSGYCSRCTNNIYDKSCKRTHIHHWIYYIIFPWFCTEELCVSCHMKESRKLERLKTITIRNDNRK